MLVYQRVFNYYITFISIYANMIMISVYIYIHTRVCLFMYALVVTHVLVL